MVPRKQRFIEEYLKDSNGAAAARRAGYSKKTSAIKGCQLLKEPEIAKAVAEGQKALRKKAEIEQEQVLKEEACIAFLDPAKLFKNGVPLFPEQLPPKIRRAISSFQVTTDPEGGSTIRYRFWNKGKALERISKHLGMYQDVQRVEHTGADGGPIQYTNFPPEPKTLAEWEEMRAEAEKQRQKRKEKLRVVQGGKE